MSVRGQTRHFDSRPVTSGLPPTPDILSTRRHVSKVPAPDSCTAASSVFIRSSRHYKTPRPHSLTSPSGSRAAVAGRRMAQPSTPSPGSYAWRHLRTWVPMHLLRWYSIRPYAAVPKTDMLSSRTCPRGCPRAAPQHDAASKFRSLQGGSAGGIGSHNNACKNQTYVSRVSQEPESAVRCCTPREPTKEEVHASYTHN
jgi:hypothetical protein